MDNRVKRFYFSSSDFFGNYHFIGLNFFNELKLKFLVRLYGNFSFYCLKRKDSLLVSN